MQAKVQRLKTGPIQLREHAPTEKHAGSRSIKVAAPPLDSPCDGPATYPGDTKILVKSSTWSVVLLNKKKIHIHLSQVHYVWQVVKTPTIISNNPVFPVNSTGSDVTACSGHILEKFTVSWSVRKIPASWGSRTFITEFTGIRHVSTLQPDHSTQYPLDLF